MYLWHRMTGNGSNISGKSCKPTIFINHRDDAAQEAAVKRFEVNQTRPAPHEYERFTGM